MIDVDCFRVGEGSKNSEEEEADEVEVIESGKLYKAYTNLQGK